MFDLKWFKLDAGLFGNRKIRILERRERGSELILTWIRLLCLAAELNDGGEIYVIKDSPLSIEDISAMLGIDEALAAEALG
ncbi:MAG: phage replisome organizer N-terminal domain-containing protein, partial [Clostridia bacterium]|nr:phage replisome organizer N-terminal domain-containing protein [Clostridia bacterium]